VCSLFRYLQQRFGQKRELVGMAKSPKDESLKMQRQIKMLPVVAVAVFLVSAAVFAIRNGELSALLITLGCGFVFAEILRRKGVFVWNWDPDRALERIRAAETREMAWKEICKALDTLRFDYAKMSFQNFDGEQVFVWIRNKADTEDRSWEFQASLPLDRFGLGAGSLVVGKDVSREPITKDALAWIKNVMTEA
jgi:hypothetical protein